MNFFLIFRGYQGNRQPTNTHTNMKRREFIQKGSAVAAATTVFSAIPGSVSAASRIFGANDRINVGAIGVNGMGMSDLRSFLKMDGVECLGICDVDRNVLEKKAKEATEIQGKAPRLYGDYRELLEDKDLDAVIIGTPDHWHCLPMVHACESGLDVYVEKPLANSIEEVDLMIKAQQRYGRVVQVGQWQRSDPHWKNAVDFVHSGKLGKIRTVKSWVYLDWKFRLPVEPDGPVPEGVDYDFWLGPAPRRPFNINRFHFNFRWYWDYAGGLMTDWGVHLLDYALYGMNQYVPKSVMSSGGKYAWPDDARQTPDTQYAIYEFDNIGLIWESTLGIGQGNYGRAHGVAFIGENGTLVVDRGGWEVIAEKPEGKPRMEAVPLIKKTGESGLDLHVKDFLACMKTRGTPKASVEIGGHIARVAHLGNIALRTGRKIFWDGEKGEIADDPEAARLTRASYRAPWKLPEV
jgi:predicted dehydrogenase